MRVAIAGAVAGVVVAFAGCAAVSPVPSSSYGGWPTFLPSPSVGFDQALTGSQASPALTVQGDAVNVELPGGGTVLVTVAGPQFDGQNAASPSQTIECAWTVTMSDVTVAVDIAESEFAVRDSLGTVHWPTFADGAATPLTVKPGQQTSFVIRTGIPAGEGIVQWAPDGKLPVATWDFVLEND